jgi:signal transduction histidine kinase/CheY-like chemotaxis protein
VIGIRSEAGARWGIFTAVPLAGAQGEKLDGAVLMFVDITDRKNAEEERLRLEAQVQHAQKLESLGVLAGGIAHDFNNLLTGILGNVSLAKMKVPAGSGFVESLDRVERAAERAAELTNQMLAYAGKGSFVVGSIALNAVIRELVPLLGSSVSKKARLEYALDPELPEIQGDRSQIEQVVMNLITNASDALEDGEGAIALRTGVTRDVRGRDREVPFVVLEVADDGKGMNEETRARMFDPFFTTKFTGRGLGLAAVQGIVRGHGGSIRVETRPGEGTKFTILFPAGRSERVEPAERLPADARPGSGTILVIDDEESVREVARTSLELAGYGVVLAKDGIEGVETFRSRKGDVAAAVVDVSMPRMSGEETLVRLRALDPALPVLLTSGYTEQAARESLTARAAAAFIQKPFRAAQLVEAVEVLLERKPASR